MNDTEGDDEILEVFAEEAGEVFETIDNRLPVWRERTSDKNALTDIRRGFHTLKGSGRMVNALDLAEVAWKVENMLNRVIDGSVQPSEHMVDLVSAARDLMPTMLDAFREHRPMSEDSVVVRLMEEADALASGHLPSAKRAQPVPAPVVAAGDEESLVIKIAELNRRLERFHQRSDEALHRSEMALQHARRLAAHIDAKHGDPQDRVGRAEVNRVIERVNLMARELLDLRREVERPPPDPHPNAREIGQIVDHRLRERVAPIEQHRNELEQKLADARSAASASGIVAWSALALSVLVGGGAMVMVLLSGAGG